MEAEVKYSQGDIFTREGKAYMLVNLLGAKGVINLYEGDLYSEPIYDVQGDLTKAQMLQLIPHLSHYKHIPRGEITDDLLPHNKMNE